MQEQKIVRKLTNQGKFSAVDFIREKLTTTGAVQPHCLNDKGKVLPLLK